MKTKIVFTIIFITILSAGVAFLVFLTQKGGSVTTALELGSRLEIQPEQKTEAPAVEPGIPQIEVDTDYFTLTLPATWGMTSEENTLPIIAVDSEEEILDEKAKEINFRTNLSINTDDLGENSFKAYVEGVKIGLINKIPLIEITKEKEVTIDGKEAYFMEIDSIQQDLRFATLAVLVAGKGNSTWAFSFNTLGESWLKYKDVFYKTIEGLRIK